MTRAADGLTKERPSDMLAVIETGYLDVLTPDPVIPDETWLEGACGDILCANCRCIDRSQYPRPCDIAFEQPPEDQACAPVTGTGVMVFGRDVLELLRPHLDAFVLGDCFLADGTRLDAYATCYDRRFLVVRGNRQSRYRLCDHCSSIVANLGNSPRYVLHRALWDAVVFQDAECRLHLREELARELDFSGWDDIGAVSWIALRDTPVDGQHLPGDRV